MKPVTKFQFTILGAQQWDQPWTCKIISKNLVVVKYGGSNYEYEGMCEQVNENFSLKEKIIQICTKPFCEYLA